MNPATPRSRFIAFVLFKWPPSPSPATSRQLRFPNEGFKTEPECVPSLNVGILKQTRHHSRVLPWETSKRHLKKSSTWGKSSRGARVWGGEGGKKEGNIPGVVRQDQNRFLDVSGVTPILQATQLPIKTKRRARHPDSLLATHSGRAAASTPGDCGGGRQRAGDIFHRKLMTVSGYLRGNTPRLCESPAHLHTCHWRRDHIRSQCFSNPLDLGFPDGRYTPVTH